MPCRKSLEPRLYLSTPWVYVSVGLVCSVNISCSLAQFFPRLNNHFGHPSIHLFAIAFHDLFFLLRALFLQSTIWHKLYSEPSCCWFFAFFLGIRRLIWAQNPRMRRSCNSITNYPEVARVGNLLILIPIQNWRSIPWHTKRVPLIWNRFPRLLWGIGASGGRERLSNCLEWKAKQPANLESRSFPTRSMDHGY